MTEVLTLFSTSLIVTKTKRTQFPQILPADRLHFSKPSLSEPCEM